jgi:UDP-N-acetylmuramoyl-L-alanyl-D-glutamate--2,6-diaminopimelate ligase
MCFSPIPATAGDGRAIIDAAVEQGAAAVRATTMPALHGTPLDVPLRAVANLKQLAGEIAHAFYGHAGQACAASASPAPTARPPAPVAGPRAVARRRTDAVIGTLGVGYVNGMAAEFSSDRLHHAGRSAAGAHAGRVAAPQGARRWPSKHRPSAWNRAGWQRHAFRRGAVHQPDARPPGLPRHHGSVRGGQDPAVRLARPATAVMNLDDPMGQRLVAHLRGKASGEVPVIGYSLTRRAAMPAACRCCAPARCAAAGGTEFHLSRRLAWRRSHAAGRPLQCQQRARRAGRSAGARHGAARGGRCASKRCSRCRAACSWSAATMRRWWSSITPIRRMRWKKPSPLCATWPDRHGQLWCVFGCGGDRDPGKRPQMGGIAQLPITCWSPATIRAAKIPHIIEQIIEGMDFQCNASATAQMEDRAAAILTRSSMRRQAGRDPAGRQGP